MKRHDRLLALGLTCGLAMIATAAPAQTPCIDTRPVGFMGHNTELTFAAADGRTVTRNNLVLLGYDPATQALTLDDAGQTRSLSLREWTSLAVTIQRPPQHVQMPLAPSMPIANMLGQKYPLASMKIDRGVIAFGDCTNMSAADRSEEVKFNGKLTFDAGAGGLTIDGMFVKFSAPPASSFNPGRGK